MPQNTPGGFMVGPNGTLVPKKKPNLPGPQNTTGSFMVGGTPQATTPPAAGPNMRGPGPVAPVTELVRTTPSATVPPQVTTGQVPPPNPNDPSSPGFWVTLPNGDQVPFNHPSAQQAGAAPSPAGSQGAPAAIGPKVQPPGMTPLPPQVTTGQQPTGPNPTDPSSPGFWVTLPNGDQVPFNHPAAQTPGAQPSAPGSAGAPPSGPGTGVGPGGGVGPGVPPGTPPPAKPGFLGTTPPPLTPNTIQAGFQAKLLQLLNGEQTPDVNDPQIRAAQQALSTKQQREFQGAQQQLAEAFGAGGGSLDDPAFRNELLGLRGEQAIAGQQQLSELMLNERQNQLAEAMQAFELAGDLLTEEEKLLFQQYIAELDANLRRDLQAQDIAFQQGEGALERALREALGGRELDIREDLGGRELDIRETLGEGQLDLGFAGLDVQKLLGMSELELRRAIAEAELNQNPLLSLLPLLG